MDTLMDAKEKVEGWVYVFVSDPGGNEEFLGLHDKEKEIDFIPAFEDKDAATDCFLTIQRKKGVKYEVQAVHIEELVETAEKNGFIVAIVDSDGKIVKEPMGTA